MDASATMDACNIQQKSGSDAESTEQALLMPVQLLMTGAATPGLGQAHEGQVGSDGHLMSGFGRENERLYCQVADCAIDLRSTKPYCIKKRLCPEHLTAHAVRRRGGVKGFWRFCQQCGKLEPLESFDGTKRSCRARLQKRRAHNVQRAADPWRSGKHKGQSYKAKQLQRQKQGSATVAVAEDDEDYGGMDDTDGDDDEMQMSDGMHDRSQVRPAALAAAAAAADSYGGGHGLPEYLDTTAAAPGHASLCGSSIRHQQQQILQSALYKAAMAAATAGNGSQAPHTGPSASNRSAGLHTSQEAIAGSSKVNGAEPDGGGGHHHSQRPGSHHQGLAQPDTAWPSNSGYVASPQKQQEEQQEQEVPTPESIAATLAAMAAAARRSDQHHLQQLVKQEQPLQQSPMHQHHQQQQPQQWQPQQHRASPAEAAAAAAAAVAYGTQQVDATRSQSSREEPSTTSSHQQQQQQQAQQFVYGDAMYKTSDYERPANAQYVVNGHNSFKQCRDQQQQQRKCVAADLMEVDAAAAAAMPAAPQSSAATRARMLAAAAAAAVAADADHGQSSPAGRHQKLQLLLGRLIGDMVPQADAAATLAAMRAQQPSTAPVSTAPVSAATTGRQEDSKGPDLHHYHQQQQQPPDVEAFVPAHITTPTGPGIFSAHFGSAEHVDQATVAAAMMKQTLQQQQQHQQQQEMLALGLHGQISAVPGSSAYPVLDPPAVLQGAVQARSTAAPSPPAATATAAGCEHPQELAAGGSKETGGADGSLGMGEGLGVLLSAGLNSIMGQQGQKGTAGTVQLLAGVLAQAPTAAATLLLAQQQQLQQLQAQQQQLTKQLARQQEQQEQQYNTLLAAISNSSRGPSHVTADVVELVRDQLQAVSEQVVESLAPLQGQVDGLRADLGRLKSVVQATGLQTELDRIKDAVSNLLQH